MIFLQDKQKHFLNRPFTEILLKGLILTGILLALTQLIYSRSLWFDEASLAINVFKRDFEGLLKPLERDQAAPIGFLILTKILVTVFGYNDISLRLVSFLSFCLSVLVLYKFSRLIFGSKLKSLTAVALFSLSINQIYYATEFKQYATDILFALLLAYTTMKYKTGKSNFWYLLLAVFASLWFSHAAIIMTSVCLVYLFFFRIKNKKILILAGSFALSFAMYYFLFVKDHPTRDFMLSYWAKSFLPLDSLNSFFDFLRRSLNLMLVYYLPFGSFIWFSGSLVLMGIISGFVRKEYNLIFFLFAALFIHLALSALHLYPFAFRFGLYLSPFFILILTEGVFIIIKPINNQRMKSAIILAVVLPLFIPLYKRFPLKKEELKPVIKSFLAQGDKEPVYVYYRAEPAFTHYTFLYPELKSRKLFYGKDLSFNPQKFLADFPETDTFWIFFTHVHHYKDGYSERKKILEFIYESEMEIINRIEERGASAYKIERGN